MSVQLKEKKSKQAASAGPSAEDRDGVKPGGKPIESRLLDFARGTDQRPRLMMVGGASQGVQVGMMGYIKDGAFGMLASFEVEAVEQGRSYAYVDIARSKLKLHAQIVINATAPRMREPSARPRILARNVAGNGVEIQIGNGRDEGVVAGMHGHLITGSGAKGPPFTVQSVNGRRAIAYLANTTIDEVARYPQVIFESTPRNAPVQRRAAGAATATDVESTAQAGVAGATSQLPFFDTIQRSFGKHDISGVRAQVGGPATAASRALGAQAYATGNTVAFASAPDLHTAAHEAAHTVQQARGAVGFQGLGAADDEHERHADAVADAVVAGGSAEALLDGASAGSGQTMAVQRKAIHSETAGHKEPSYVVPGSGELSHVGSIYFRTKDARVDARDRELFAELAASYAPYAKRNLGQAGRSLGIEGKVVAYADPRRSSEPSNQALSGERANAVATGLERALVDATRLDIGSVHLARVGAGVDPDAMATEKSLAEGNTLAPFRRADMFLSGAQATAATRDDNAKPAAPLPSGRLQKAPEITLDHDRWMPQILEGDKRVIEGIAARIGVDLGPNSMTGGRSDVVKLGGWFTAEKPPWWDGRAAGIAHDRQPPSQGRSAAKNADATKRAGLVHDTLLLLRDYKEIHYYEETHLGPAVNAIANSSSVDPRAMEDHNRALRYMIFMYEATESLAWKVHRAAR